MPWNGTMRQRMQVWRAINQLTQADAAQLAGVSLATWSRWERGTHRIPYREWQRLARMIDEWDPLEEPAFEVLVIGPSPVEAERSEPEERLDGAEGAHPA